MRKEKVIKEDWFDKALLDNVINNVYFKAGYEKGREDCIKEVLEIIDDERNDYCDKCLEDYELILKRVKELGK